MARHVAALAEDGFPGRLLEREELPPALRRSAHNACLTDHDGALHPARWMRALARGAEAAGARIHEGSPVVAPPSGAEAVAAGGAVRARAVVVAADGALPALVPALSGRVRARRLHMVATEPVAERLIDCPVYARFGYEYFQQLPDGRVAGGGFSDLDARRLLHRPRRGQPARLGAHRALAARGPRRGRARDPPLGRAPSATARTGCRSPGRSPASTGCTPPAATPATATSRATWRGGGWRTDLAR